jgi:hypothetical protein
MGASAFSVEHESKNQAPPDHGDVDLAGQQLPQDHPLLRDDVLDGIGSGGPGFNNYRPNELEFFYRISARFKAPERSRAICSDRLCLFLAVDRGSPYGRKSAIQAHAAILRVPDKVERISSNNDG